MDKTLTEPVTEADVNALINWNTPHYAAIPADQRPRIVTYETAIAGIPDCFDSFDVHSLRSHAADVIELSDNVVATEIDTFVRGYFQMLDSWHDAIDHLDSDLRGNVMSGAVPEWARFFLKAQAQSLFGASDALLRAVAQYHHGTAGPGLSESYGFAYALSNGVLDPF